MGHACLRRAPSGNKLSLPAFGASAAEAAATAAIAVTIGAESAAGASAFGLGTGFVNVQCAAVEFGAVQLRDCCFRIALLGHFDERKAAGLTAVAVGYDVDALDGAIGEGGGLPEGTRRKF
jgi:hypothetical protein